MEKQTRGMLLNGLKHSKWFKKFSKINFLYYQSKSMELWSLEKFSDQKKKFDNQVLEYECKED